MDNRNTFKIKTGYCLDFWMPKLMKLFGSTENKIICWIILVHCNIVNNDYQQDSRILSTLVPNNSLGQLLDISPTNVIFPKTFNSKFSYIKLYFTVQNRKPLETEDRINWTLVTNWCVI